jgi:hypothetical protein
MKMSLLLGTDIETQRIPDRIPVLSAVSLKTRSKRTVVIKELGVWFSGMVLAYYAQSPGFDPQHCKNKQINNIDLQGKPLSCF